MRLNINQDRQVLCYVMYMYNVTHNDIIIVTYDITDNTVNVKISKILWENTWLVDLTFTRINCTVPHFSISVHFTSHKNYIATIFYAYGNS